MASRELLKWVRKLHLKKYREQESCFIIEGPNLVLEALRSDFQIVNVFVIPEFQTSGGFKQMEPFFEKRSLPVQQISVPEMKMISETRLPQGILGVVRKKPRSFRKHDVSRWTKVILLDHLQEPGNLGTIIRAADWFGFQAVLTSEGSVESTNGKVLRSTAGSYFHLPVFEAVPLRGAIETLLQERFWVFAAQSDGDLIHFKAQFGEKTALVIGNERHGVKSDFSGLPVRTVRIPRSGRGESLNAAMAAAVLMDRITFSEDGNGA